ncbi:hypothetical protein [Bradyrhizobium sp. 134]|uniref:hypothetical protein n=1 Tax=unclassified Bradyrhizobium TaxID=2631580 RepID=UPI00320A22BC
MAASNKVSRGKMLSSRTRRSGGRAAALLRLAAVTVGRTDTALGAFYRRLSSRIGKAKAVTATARKIAVLFYNAVRHNGLRQSRGLVLRDTLPYAGDQQFAPTCQGFRLCSAALGTGSWCRFLGSFSSVSFRSWRAATSHRSQAWPARRCQVQKLRKRPPPAGPSTP